MTHSLVVVAEGIGTPLFGAYGSATARTPNIDRLAGKGLLLDQCYCDSQSPFHCCESGWTAMHALGQSSDWSIWSHLAVEQIPQALITDCPEVAQIGERLGCETIHLVDAESTGEIAEESTECVSVNVFATAISEIADSPGGLIWVHSRALRHCWDVPLDIRKSFTDPGLVQYSRRIIIQ